MQKDDNNNNSIMLMQDTKSQSEMMQWNSPLQSFRLEEPKCKYLTSVKETSLEANTNIEVLNISKVT